MHKKSTVSGKKRFWSQRPNRIVTTLLFVVNLVGSVVLVLGCSTPIDPGPSGTPTRESTPQATPTATSYHAPTNQGQVVYTSPPVSPPESFYAFAWSPDSKRVASSSSQVQIWDATTGKRSLTFTHSGEGVSAESLSWSPNGRYLALASGQVQIINAATGAVVRTFPNPVGISSRFSGSHISAMASLNGGTGADATAWSPDGTLMATALYGAYGNVVDVWNPSTGQIVFTFHGQSSNEVASISWSPDGKYIASAGFDGTVQVWNIHTGQVIFIDRTTSGLAAVWGPRGMILAFISNDNTIQVWNVTTNTEITRYRAPTNSALVWSPDGNEIASASGDHVIIWNAITGQTIYTFIKQNTYVRALAWSPDGKYIVSGGNFDYNFNYPKAEVWIA